jgi:hypothetical protein
MYIMKNSKPLILIILIIINVIIYKLLNNNYNITGGGKKEIKKTYVNQNKLGYYDDNYPGYEDGVDGIEYGQVEATVDAPLWKFGFELARRVRQISNEDTELFLSTL